MHYSTCQECVTLKKIAMVVAVPVNQLMSAACIKKDTHIVRMVSVITGKLKSTHTVLHRKRQWGMVTILLP